MFFIVMYAASAESDAAESVQIEVDAGSEAYASHATRHGMSPCA